MNVSIIIVNYNTTQLLLQCLDSITAQTHSATYEIIVVDNGSREEELAPIRQDRRITQLELQQNLGFGRANNAGAAHAQGEYLFLLNPDTILVNDAVSLLYQHLTSNPTTGICGGNIFDADMQPIHAHDTLPPSILQELDIVFAHLYSKLVFGKNAWFNHTGKNMKVALITGADIMIRRAAWEAVGGFDPAFFMYYEDADLCVNVSRQGYDIVNVPQARIIHLEGKSFSESRARTERYFTGRSVFFHKHYSAFYNKVADLLNVLTLKTGIFAFRLLGKPQTDVYRQRLDVYKQIMKQAREQA